jgi:kynurenine 3-monooxygenase
MEQKREAIIIGAGLVGSLWAVYLSKAGYNVTIYERRPDIRKAEISAGKSINLALSVRGWAALDAVGVGDEIRKIAIPMYGRMMHALNGDLTYQQYGHEGQAIFSVSRGKINATMMDIAEKHGKASIHYQTECLRVDTKNAIAYLRHIESGQEFEAKADVIFAADGAFSAVRYHSMQKLDRFQYSQNYIADGYREILLPALADGSYPMDKNALHIWPRGRFMLIALANEDGSFTCTLFMPHADHEFAFDKLKTKADVDRFFLTVFPDFHQMMPDIADKWEDHPLSNLAIIRCYPWAHGKVGLMGDAAHATVPFYGQGMNAGFEDCRVLNDLMLEHNHDWDKIWAAYSPMRKPNGDALQDLSLDNYIEMRDLVGDPSFLLRKKIEAKFSNLYPNKWLPLYSQVTFSNIPYSVAYEQGKKQRDIMDEIMADPNIENTWDSPEIMQAILHQCSSFNFQT